MSGGAGGGDNCRENVCKEGGGAKYAFSGPNCPPRRISLQIDSRESSDHLRYCLGGISGLGRASQGPIPVSGETFDKLQGPLGPYGFL